MKSVFKRIITLASVVIMLSILIMLASCDAYDSVIESFIKSDNYTIESENYSLTVDGASVNFKMDNAELYLYYDKSAKSYFYVNILEDEITKLAIDSEQYITYYKAIVSPASNMAAKLSGFKQIRDLFEEADGKYTISEDENISYTVAVSDGVINYTVDNEGDENDYSYKIHNIGSTKVVIPDNVNNAEIVEE